MLLIIYSQLQHRRDTSSAGAVHQLLRHSKIGLGKKSRTHARVSCIHLYIYTYIFPSLRLYRDNRPGPHRAVKVKSNAGRLTPDPLTHPLHPQRPISRAALLVTLRLQKKAREFDFKRSIHRDSSKKLPTRSSFHILRYQEGKWNRNGKPQRPRRRKTTARSLSLSLCPYEGDD